MVIRFVKYSDAMNNKIPLFLLMLAGEVLLCVGMVLLLGDVEPTNLLVVNTVAISMVYLLIFASSFDLFDEVSVEGSSTAGLGLTIYGVVSFAVLSICCIVASYVWRWDLAIAILAQGGALFVLFTFLILSRMALSGVTEGTNIVESRKESLRHAMHLLDRVELQAKIDGSKPRRAQDVEKIKEELRYVTFSDRDNAQYLDDKLIGAIGELSSLLSSATSDNRQWSDVVDRCLVVIKQRKQQL